MSKKSNTEVAVADHKGTEVAELEANEFSLPMEYADMAADAGAGLEGADNESFAIPFLSVLQDGSPQTKEHHPKGGYIEGAKAGMFFDNVSNGLMDGKAGVLFVPCAFKRSFIIWGSEASGEGYKGELTPEQVAQWRAEKKIVEFENRLYIPLPDGSVSEKRCERVSDTRNHFGLLVTEDGDYREVLFSLSSTQIKKSKLLLAAISNVKLRAPNGARFNPPSWANLVRITTIPESNEKGSWFGVRFSLEGLTNREIYNAAKAFHARIIRGNVVVKYEDAADGADEGEAEGF